MSEPALPFGLKPAVAISIGESVLIGSGVFVARPMWTVDLAVADLKFVLKFEDDGGQERKLDMVRPDEKSLTITLRNFTNALGTAVRPINIAQVNERPVWLALYVEALPEVKAISYSIFWGGDLGGS